MLFAPHSLIGRLLHKLTVVRWRAASREAANADLTSLAAQNQMAQRLLRPLRKLSTEAESRLALPRIGSSTFPRPAGTDWSWRPKAWRISVPERGTAPAAPKTALTDEILIFHDCSRAEISLRQTRNIREDDLAPFSVVLEVFHFEGTYLSLVIEVPPSSCEGLRRRHLIQLAAVIEREQPTNIHARLNVKHGPNTEQVLLTLPNDGPETMVEFDLAYSQLNERRADRMWIDLMIETPRMNQITLRDLTLSRYPRAEI
jgi:hypothetical protein